MGARYHGCGNNEVSAVGIGESRAESNTGRDLEPGHSAENQRQIPIIVADTHPLLGEGIRAMVERTADFTVVACVSTIAELLDAIGDHRDGIAVVDMTLEGGRSFDQLEAIRVLAPDLKIVMLAAELDADAAIEAVRHDVAGLLLKTMPPELLITCLRKVAGGGRWVEMKSLGSAIERMLETDENRQSARQLLSERELEMVRFVCEGLRNREIARRAHVSEGTVKTHLHNIYQKLGVDSRLALMRYAQERGWVSANSDD